uniref:sialate O-acetylesterase n=1 Tax=Porcine torovirus TaxID=237020 RepID=A0A679C9S7_9NIDO|nr:HE protein [Porcine torovirus]
MLRMRVRSPSAILIFVLLPLVLTSKPITPHYGPGHITSDWCGFGDSRSDCGNQHTPKSLDIPQELCPKFSSRTGSSMFISMHWNNGSGFDAFDYFNCGVEKVFYEGVNFSPYRNYTCYQEGSSGWVNNKVGFYSKLYSMASTSRCIKLINLDPPTNFTNYRNGTCIGNGGNAKMPDNPQLVIFDAVIKVSTQFVLPNSSDGISCTKHLVPFCYIDGGCFDTSGVCYPFGYYYESPSFYHGFYTNGTAGLHRYICDYLEMKPGVYNATTFGKFLIYPTKSYCMDTMNYTVPVQAVQSIWSEKRQSDDAIGQACKPPYCIFYNKTKPYLAPNGADENHGDEEVRQMMQGLLVNSSCISPQGSTPLALYSSEMIYIPNYGSCPQYYKLFETSSDENVDVTSSAYFVATWVLLVLVIILIFILISFCLSSY